MRSKRSSQVAGAQVASARSLRHREAALSEQERITLLTSGSRQSSPGSSPNPSAEKLGIAAFRQRKRAGRGRDVPSSSAAAGFDQRAARATSSLLCRTTADDLSAKKATETLDESAIDTRGSPKRPKTNGRNKTTYPSLVHAADVKDEERFEEAGADTSDRVREALAAASTKFHLWYHLLVSGGFSILVHGKGSKRVVLDAFAEYLRKRVRSEQESASGASSSTAILAIYGFNPFIQLRTVLQEVADALAQAQPMRAASRKTSKWDVGPRSGRSLMDLLEFIRKHYVADACQRLFLILHNIDGAGLATPETQAAFATLASFPRIHLVASIDRMEVTVLWPVGSCYERFGWVWQDCSTHLRHTVEMSAATERSNSQSDEQVVRGATMLLSGLTPNAQRIFRTLLELQLSQLSDQSRDATRSSRSKAQVGVAFADFYRQCRTQFLVSNPNALRGMLRELEDHNLLGVGIRGRRCVVPGMESNREHSDWLQIPLSAAQMQEIFRRIS
jgi:hypothetical protein